MCNLWHVAFNCLEINIQYDDEIDRYKENNITIEFEDLVDD